MPYRRGGRSGYEGQIAGLYDLGATLGKGHYAVVKAAKHVFTGEKVAVKVIDKLKLDDVSRAHLFQEVRCMKLVQHPNVVRLYEVIDTQTKLYLVLELGDGGDLYDYIQRHAAPPSTYIPGGGAGAGGLRRTEPTGGSTSPLGCPGGGLAEDEAARCFVQIVSAIAYCHSLNVVHRDLKPENCLFVGGTHALKVTDFGFSNKFTPGRTLKTSCGSLAYSSPEILLGDEYDPPAVDVWSLGVILYMLVCGVAPFQDATDGETLIRIMDCKYSVPCHVSKPCTDLIRRMLRKNPRERIDLPSVLIHPWAQSVTFPDLTATTPTGADPNSFPGLSLSMNDTQRPMPNQNFIKTAAAQRAGQQGGVGSTRSTAGGVRGMPSPPGSVPRGLPVVNWESLTDTDHCFIIQRIVDGKIASRDQILQSLERSAFNHITATYTLLAEQILRKRAKPAPGTLTPPSPGTSVPCGTTVSSGTMMTSGVTLPLSTMMSYSTTMPFNAVVSNTLMPFRTMIPSNVMMSSSTAVPFSAAVSSNTLMSPNNVAPSNTSMPAGILISSGAHPRSSIPLCTEAAQLSGQQGAGSPLQPNGPQPPVSPADGSPSLRPTPLTPRLTVSGVNSHPTSPPSSVPLGRIPLMVTPPFIGEGSSQDLTTSGGVRIRQSPVAMVPPGVGLTNGGWFPPGAAPQSAGGGTTEMGALRSPHCSKRCSLIREADEEEEEEDLEGGDAIIKTGVTVPPAFHSAAAPHDINSNNGDRLRQQPINGRPTPEARRANGSEARGTGVINNLTPVGGKDTASEGGSSLGRKETGAGPPRLKLVMPPLAPVQEPQASCQPPVRQPVGASHPPVQGPQLSVKPPVVPGPRPGPNVTRQLDVNALSRPSSTLSPPGSTLAQPESVPPPPPPSRLVVPERSLRKVASSPQLQLNQICEEEGEEDSEGEGGGDRNRLGSDPARNVSVVEVPVAGPNGASDAASFDVSALGSSLAVEGKMADEKEARRMTRRDRVAGLIGKRDVRSMVVGVGVMKNEVESKGNKVSSSGSDGGLVGGNTTGIAPCGQAVEGATRVNVLDGLMSQTQVVIKGKDDTPGSLGHGDGRVGGRASTQPSKQAMSQPSTQTVSQPSSQTVAQISRQVNLERAKHAVDPRTMKVLRASGEAKNFVPTTADNGAGGVVPLQQGRLPSKLSVYSPFSLVVDSSPPTTLDARSDYSTPELYTRSLTRRRSASRHQRGAAGCDAVRVRDLSDVVSDTESSEPCADMRARNRAHAKLRRFSIGERSLAATEPSPAGVGGAATGVRGGATGFGAAAGGDRLRTISIGSSGANAPFAGPLRRGGSWTSCTDLSPMAGSANDSADLIGGWGGLGGLHPHHALGCSLATELRSHRSEEEAFNRARRDGALARRAPIRFRSRDFGSLMDKFSGPSGGQGAVGQVGTEEGGVE